MYFLAVNHAASVIQSSTWLTATTMWDGLSTPLSTAALGGAIGDFFGIPVVAAVVLAVLGVSVAVYGIRKLIQLAPRGR